MAREWTIKFNEFISSTRCKNEQKNMKMWRKQFMTNPLKNDAIFCRLVIPYVLRVTDEQLYSKKYIFPEI